MHTRSQRALGAIEGLGLAVVLGGAGLLRLGWVGVHSFGFDEARISLLALQMARGGQFVSVGMPSSAGVPNPPAFVWLMSLAYALSPDPLVASLLIGALNVLATLGVWYLARRAWGGWAALAAGLLLASSPFAVFYSRSVWSQDLMAPLAVLWALVGLAGVRRGSGPLLALHLFLAMFTWQVHYSGVVLLPASLWLVVRCRLWRRWPWLLAGGALAALALAPFAHALLSQGREALAGMGALASEATWPNPDAVVRWAEVGAGAHWDWLPLGEAWRWPEALAWAQRVAQGIAGGLIALGLVGLIGRAWRRRRAPQTDTEILSAWLPAWALATPLVFALTGTPVYHQYQLAALPALLLAAAATAALLPERWRWRGPLVAALALAVALPQGLSAAMSLAANRDQVQPGGLGTPLAYPRAAARLLRDEGLPVYVHAASDDPAYDADAAGMSVLLWEHPHRLVNGNAALLLPPEGETAELLFLYPDLPAASQARAHAAIVASLELPRRQGDRPYLAVRVTGGAPRGLQPSEPIALENGAVLRGWDARREGDALTLTTWWQIGEGLRPGRYHQFNHLYVAGGETPAQVYDAPLSSASWRSGDTLITWATFRPEAPGPFHLEVGMYTYPEMERVGFSGGEGSATTAIRLGPVEW